MLRVPRSWLEKERERLEKLTENRDINVSILDIIPTLVETMGLLEKKHNREIAGKLSGLSLFNPLPADRPLIAVNVTDVRKLSHAAFGIVWKNYRLVYLDSGITSLFDINKDPDQQQDI